MTIAREADSADFLRIVRGATFATVLCGASLVTSLVLWWYGEDNGPGAPFVRGMNAAFSLAAFVVLDAVVQPFHVWGDGRIFVETRSQKRTNDDEVRHVVRA